LRIIDEFFTHNKLAEKLQELSNILNVMLISDEMWNNDSEKLQTLTEAIGVFGYLLGEIFKREDPETGVYIYYG